jgi:hypothetical protein
MLWARYDCRTGMLWARYDCRTGKKEELLEHLKSVGENANKIAQCLREVLNDMHTEAYYAGIFHDLFK